MLNINVYVEDIRGSEFYDYEDELNEVINDEVDFFLNEIDENKYQFANEGCIIFFNDDGTMEKTEEEIELTKRLNNIYGEFILGCELARIE